MRTKGPAHADTKQRILEVARKHVLKHGHARLSLRAIAREAGFSAPSLYEYFDSKQAIVDAIAGRIAASLRAVLRKHADEASDPRGALVAIGVGYVAWARRHPQDFMLLFGRMASKRGALTQAPAVDSPYQVVIAAVSAAQVAGVIHDGAERAEQMAYVLWATVHGMAMLQLTHLAGFDADFDAGDRIGLEALIDGFAPA